MQRFPVVLLLLSLAGSAGADTFQVTRGDDPVPDGCLTADCSLREALEAAQATPGADTILLGTGQYFVTRGDLDAFGSIVVEGAGRDATRIIFSGAPSLLHVAAQSDFVLRRARIVANGGTAIRADGDHSSTLLEDVDVPTGEVAAGNAGDVGNVSLRVRDSSIGYIAACVAAEGLCEFTGSTVGAAGAIGERIALHMARSEVVGPDAGVIAYGAGGVLIEDSTVRNAARPLEFLQTGAVDAPEVLIRRTRFIGNTGPIRGRRDSIIRMDEVEFRDNVVDDQHLNDGDPAVLLAEDDTAWRISRALFIGNRGGGGTGPDLIGSTVRLLAGANVVMGEVTFTDNTFRPEVAVGAGHAIGVDGGSGDATVLWLLHATLRSLPAVAAETATSLLAVRGTSANVRIYNSVLHGSCGFASGGILFHAVGDIESPGNTCQFTPADNDVDIPASDLFLGPLGDNGGFTRTFMPTRYSPLVDRGATDWCNVSAVAFGRTDQRRYPRPADGVGCDIGAVEKDAVLDEIFADGFEP